MRTTSASPVDPRSKAIIDRSKKLARPVRFSDLQQRWAMDRRYADKIRSIADAFNDNHCRGRQIEPQETARAVPLPAPVAIHNGRLAGNN